MTTEKTVRWKVTLQLNNDVLDNFFEDLDDANEFVSAFQSPPKRTPPLPSTIQSSDVEPATVFDLMASADYLYFPKEESQ